MARRPVNPEKQKKKKRGDFRREAPLPFYGFSEEEGGGEAHDRSFWIAIKGKKKRSREVPKLQLRGRRKKGAETTNPLSWTEKRGNPDRTEVWKGRANAGYYRNGSALPWPCNKTRGKKGKPRLSRLG